ncbi:MAG: sigma-70 family RNA polymerase sigma factor [Oscillospiraceae bacterium]|nr:sigma-70 family RNA polymerase sigma factor [Oscillospiraceae bacterium]
MEAIALKEGMQAKAKMDVELLESIYRQYYKNVYNYIGFRINNHFDAEELASLVFEKAISKWGRYNPDFPVEAWLISIAKNTVTDYLRAKKRKYFVSLDNIIDFVFPGAQPDEMAVRDEENRALMVAMAKLKDQERQILSMKFATDLGHREIAQILGLSDSNVGVIVHRAIKKLRKLMGGEEDEA